MINNHLVAYACIWRSDIIPKDKSHANGSYKNTSTDYAGLFVGTETDQLRKIFLDARSKDVKLGMLLKVLWIITDIIRVSYIIYTIKSNF